MLVHSVIIDNGFGGVIFQDSLRTLWGTRSCENQSTSVLQESGWEFASECVGCDDGDFPSNGEDKFYDEEILPHLSHDAHKIEKGILKS